MKPFMLVITSLLAASVPTATFARQSSGDQIARQEIERQIDATFRRTPMKIIAGFSVNQEIIATKTQNCATELTTTSGTQALDWTDRDKPPSVGGSFGRDEIDVKIVDKPFAVLRTNPSNDPRFYAAVVELHAHMNRYWEMCTTSGE